MISLAIDASTPVCAVSLKTNNGISSKWEKGQGVHSERLFGQIIELLQDAEITLKDVDDFVITSGPGSYTGLRIAASALKGLLFGTEKQITAVQTLAYFAYSISQSYPDAKRIHAVIDARRTHLFHQLFEKDSSGQFLATELLISDLETIKSAILPGDYIGGTGMDRLNLTANDVNQVILVNERVTQDTTHLCNFSTNNCGLNTFYSKVHPALFEPNYYTSGHAQVHQSVKP